MPRLEINLDALFRRGRAAGLQVGGGWRQIVSGSEPQPFPSLQTGLLIPADINARGKVSGCGGASLHFSRCSTPEDTRSSDTRQSVRVILIACLLEPAVVLIPRLSYRWLKRIVHEDCHNAAHNSLLSFFHVFLFLGLETIF